MPNRIPSDHTDIETHRVTVARHGGRGRRLEVPAGIIPTEDRVRLLIDGKTTYPRITAGNVEKQAWLTGAYESPQQSGGPNRLDKWLSAHDIMPGSSILLDVIEADFLYGVRRPGTRVIYEAVSAPSSSLRDIAERFGTDSI